MQERRLLGIADLAVIFDKTTSWTYKNWRRLCKERKFPAPIEGFGCNWDSRAVELWLDMQLPDYLKANDNQPKKYWQQILDANAANL